MSDIERALTFIESMKLGVNFSRQIENDAKLAILADLDILEKMLKAEIPAKIIEEE